MEKKLGSGDSSISKVLSLQARGLSLISRIYIKRKKEIQVVSPARKPSIEEMETGSFLELTG